MRSEREVATGAPGGAAGEPGRGAALDRLRRFGGEELLREMALIFVSDMPARVDRLRAGVQGGDLAAVALAAHMMKASSGQFGAVALQRLCAEAEEAARADDLAALPPLVAGIEREFTQYRKWLEREVPLARAPGRRE